MDLNFAGCAIVSSLEVSILMSESRISHQPVLGATGHPGFSTALFLNLFFSSFFVAAPSQIPLARTRVLLSMCWDQVLCLSQGGIRVGSLHWRWW